MRDDHWERCEPKRGGQPHWRLFPEVPRVPDNYVTNRHIIDHQHL